jgi:hypothetical protein
MKMPAMFSRKWWKLWRSGAIDREQVFFLYLDSLMCTRVKDAPELYRVSKPWPCSRFLSDVCAVAWRDLRLPERVYTEATRKLFGGVSAREVEDLWYRKCGGVT